MKGILILALAALLVVAACGGADNDQLPPVAAGDTPTVVPEEKAPAKDSIAAFFASGVGIECTYDRPGGDHEIAQFLGKNAHITVTGEGARELIVTEEAFYAKSDQPGCDWVSIPAEEDSVPAVEADWTIVEMERMYNVMYQNANCVKKSFSSSTFTPSGKICDMEEMMMQAFGDLGLE